MMMNQVTAFCDWGTSSLRVRLVDTATGAILGEVRNNRGVASVFAAWEKRLAGPVRTSSIREEFFLNELRGALRHVDSDISCDAPLVISGMASSSIGMLELPYAELPCSISGEGMITHTLQPSEEFPFSVIVISGVKDGDEVMRGEETQVIGLSDTLSRLGNNVLVVLPGTHSKHVRVQDSRIVGFDTYLTGELFSILSGNGLFKSAVEPVRAGDDSLLWKAFEAGISASGASGMLNSLFRIRTNRLFNRFDKQENYQYLSGLLIGYELRNLVGTATQQVLLCSGVSLHHSYVHALQHLGLERTVYIMEPGEADMAAVRGQRRIADR